MINMRLAEERNLSEYTINRINLLYVEEDIVFNRMKATNNPEELQLLADDWHNIQYQLQNLWGFEEDRAYHRWWNLPKCTCPKIDNDDAWPTGYYYVSDTCPIHNNINV